MIRRPALIFVVLSTAYAAPGDLPDPRADYRRVEVLVSTDFTVDCNTRRRTTSCAINQRPTQLSRLLLALGNTGMASLELGKAKGEGALIRFQLSRPDARVQSKVLPAPPRWVVEIGTPLTLVGPIEDELPFRAYPMPTGTISLTVPPSRSEPSQGDTPEARQYNTCFDFWKARRFRQAVAACEKVDRDLPTRPTTRQTTMLLGEIWGDWYEARGTADWAAAARALTEAERAARDPVLATRYAIRAARVLERHGFANRAERRIAERVPSYRGTTGEPYILAARARLLMMEDDDREARRVLEELQQLPGNAPTVGDALIALAGMAYEEKQFLLAVGLFDTVKKRWPEKLSRDPAPLFQAAELFMKYRRVDEAQGLYEEFLERFPQDLPNWVVRVRLTEIVSYAEPRRAAKLFETLASTLPETEGQDLAFLRYASLIERPNDRRRIIGNLRRSALSDFVMQELLVRAVRDDIGRGKLKEAYEAGRRLWTVFPDSDYLKRAPLVFDRALLLHALDLLRTHRPLRLLALYDDAKARFEGSALRGEAHLLVGRGLRELAMSEEAVGVLQNGLGGTTEKLEPDASARLYLEMAGVLREFGDTFRLGEILEYLDRRHPRRFDNFEYWMAKAEHAKNEGKLREAREIYNFALNGPVSPNERVELAGAISEVLFELEEWPAALKALKTRIELHDAAGGRKDAIIRRDVMWRVAELEVARGNHAGVVASIARFLDDYPDDSARTEAMYFQGRSLLALGDTLAATRVWDAVARQFDEDVYSELARRELEMLRWRRESAAKVTERAGIDRPSTP